MSAEIAGVAVTGLAPGGYTTSTAGADWASFLHYDATINDKCGVFNGVPVVGVPIVNQCTPIAVVAQVHGPAAAQRVHRQEGDGPPARGMRAR